MPLVENFAVCRAHHRRCEFIRARGNDSCLICRDCALQDPSNQPQKTFIAFNQDSLQVFQQWTGQLISNLDAACWSVVNKGELSPLLDSSERVRSIVEFGNKKQLEQLVLSQVEEQIKVYEGNLSFMQSATTFLDIAHPMLLEDLHNAFINNIETDLNLLWVTLVQTVSQARNQQISREDLTINRELLNRLSEIKQNIISASTAVILAVPEFIREETEPSIQSEAIACSKAKRPDLLIQINDNAIELDEEANQTPGKKNSSKNGTTDSFMGATEKVKAHEDDENSNSTHKKGERLPPRSVDVTPKSEASFHSQTSEGLKFIIDKLEEENQNLKKMKEEMETEMNSLSFKLEEMADGNMIVEELDRMYEENKRMFADNQYLVDKLMDLEEKEGLTKARNEELQQALQFQIERISELERQQNSYRYPEMSKLNFNSTEDNGAKVACKVSEEDEHLPIQALLGKMELKINQFQNKNARLQQEKQALQNQNITLRQQVQEYSLSERQSHNMIHELRTQIKEKVDTITKTLEENKLGKNGEKMVTVPEAEYRCLLQKLEQLQEKTSELVAEKNGLEKSKEDFRLIVDQFEKKVIDLEKNSNDWIQELEYQVFLRDQEIKRLQGLLSNSTNQAEIDYYKNRIIQLETQQSQNQANFDDQLLVEVIQLQALVKSHEDDLNKLKSMFDESLGEVSEARRGVYIEKLQKSVKYFSKRR